VVIGGNPNSSAITILLVIAKALATGYLESLQTNNGLSMDYLPNAETLETLNFHLWLLRLKNAILNVLCIN
jgi:hypothetical protein